MEDIPNSDFGMGFAAHQEPSDFVSLDMENLVIVADKDRLGSNSSPRIFKSFSRKGSQRVEGAAAGDINEVEAHSSEKHAIAVHMAAAEEAITLSRVSTPTPKYRRLGSKRSSSSPWLDPRRVLMAFATISSMGTLILLYFTLSMSKMSRGVDADA